MAKIKILILGGTGEAVQLAKIISLNFSNFDIIYSLAGRTQNPKKHFGRVISGGFGGVLGLKKFIVDEDIRIVIDATHPFAQTISKNTFIACSETNILRITLARQEWQFADANNITCVQNINMASRAIGNSISRVFITTGTSKLYAFKYIENTWFLIRLIESPSSPVEIKNHEIIISRPPYSFENEKSLLIKYKIGCLISKNSGGTATKAKIDAALSLNLPIILINQPEKLPGLCVDTSQNCVEWIKSVV